MDYDPVFIPTLSWSFNGTLQLKKRNNSLPLTILNVDASKAGEYICKAETVYKTEGYGAVGGDYFAQSKLSRAILHVEADACLLNPCQNGGICQSIIVNQSVSFLVSVMKDSMVRPASFWITTSTESKDH